MEDELTEALHDFRDNLRAGVKKNFHFSIRSSILSPAAAAVGKDLPNLMLPVYPVRKILACKRPVWTVQR